MQIFNNIPALLTQNALGISESELQKSIRRLSSGLRINSGADDAAGLGINEKMRAQIKGLDQALRNSQDGISMIQTAEGALSESQSLLQRMRELSVQAANDTLTSSDRQHIQREVDQLFDELERISSTTQFNKKRILDGSYNFRGTASSDDFSVVSLASPLASTTEASGNYSLRISAKAGKAEVKKSNLFNAVNGTRTYPEGIVYGQQDATNIHYVSAVNIVEGNYRLESREVPFGGTVFLQDTTPVTNPADYVTTHGIVDLVAPGINAEGYMVPYGEYQFRATDTVPFMATYDSLPDGSGVVASVSPPTGGSFQSLSSSPPINGLDGLRAVNATMEFLADSVPEPRKDSLLWNTGPAAAADSDLMNNVLQPRPGFDQNSFTTFDVYNAPRWRLADLQYVDRAGHTEYARYTINIEIDGQSLVSGDNLGDIEQLKNILSPGGAWSIEPDDIGEHRGRFSYPAQNIAIVMEYASGNVNDAALRNQAWNALTSRLGSDLGFPPGSAFTVVDDGARLTATIDRGAAAPDLTTGTLTARDRISVTARYENVDMNGNYLIGSQISSQYIFEGIDNFITFSDPNIPYDVLEFPSLRTGGGAYPTAPTAAPTWPWSHSSGFDFATYTSPAHFGGADIVRSQAAVQGSERSGQPALTGDALYIYPRIDYVFNNIPDDASFGVGAGDIALPQLIRALESYQVGGVYYDPRIARETIYHSFQINGAFQSASNAVDYNFRSVDPTYSHEARAFFGSQTSSYFNNAGEPDSYFSDIGVWPQEQTNANLAFRYRGTDALGDRIFDVIVRGYENDGTAFEYERDDLAVTPGVRLEIADPGGSGIGTVNFDSFVMNWGALTIGDAFVVNVAAAAHASPDNTPTGVAGTGLSNFAWGTDVIQTAGHPLFDNRMGASSEYRFLDGAVSGATLELQGLFVHPVDGADEDLGIQRRGFEIEIDSVGFRPPQDVGNPLRRTTTDPDAFVGPVDEGRWILAEVNYTGASRPVASAVLSSYYFDALAQTRNETLGVSDFVREIQYNEEQEWNGSLLFDVIKTPGGAVAFRIQGHLYDGNGNYRYAEHEEYYLNPGENSDVTLFGGDAFEGLHSASPFPGVTFDLLELGADTSNFSVGDRFVLTLSADAREAGETVSSWDELNLFGDGLGTGYPLTWRFRDGILDENTLDLRLFQVDSRPMTPNGTDVRSNDVKDGLFTISAGEYHGGTERGDFEQDSATPRTVKEAAVFGVVEAKGFDARPAHYYTKLKDIGAFYDSSGRFFLDPPSVVQILQGENETQIVLSGEMEMKDLIETLNRSLYSLADDTLRHMMSQHDKAHFADWINWERHAGSLQTVPGTFVLRSAFAGKEGEYRFIGNDGVIEALNLTVIQKSEENVYSISSSDAHSGKMVASATVRSGEKNGDLLPGEAAVQFGAMSGMSSVQFNHRTGQFEIGMVKGTYERYVHLLSDSLTLQTGSNQGEDLSIRIRDMSARGLGLVPPPPSVQTRDMASSTLSRVDAAINRVSAERARLGAYQNRLEHTVSNLTVASSNLSASESRIRDLDMAKEMMNFTRLNILMQAGTSMLSQANQLPENVLRLLK